jgi:hypothetical protein
VLFVAHFVSLQVLDWFTNFGYQIPFGVSIADYILDISLGEAGYSNSGATGNAAVKELYTAFESQYGGAASVGNKAMQAGGYSSSRQQQGRNGQIMPLSTIASVGDLQGQDKAPAGSVTVTGLQPAGQHTFAVAGAGPEQQQKQQQKGGKQERAPYWEQLRVLLQRTARVRRFEQMTGQHFFQLFAVAFITGGWWMVRQPQPLSCSCMMLVGCCLSLPGYAARSVAAAPACTSP